MYLTLETKTIKLNETLSLTVALKTEAQISTDMRTYGIYFTLNAKDYSELLDTEVYLTLNKALEYYNESINKAEYIMSGCERTITRCYYDVFDKEYILSLSLKYNQEKDILESIISVDDLDSENYVTYEWNDYRKALKIYWDKANELAEMQALWADL